MPSQLSRFAAVLFTAGSIAMGSAGSAAAHAVIIDSKPTVNATLDTKDDAVVLHFNSRIDHQRSRLTVIGSDGKPTQVAIAPDGAPDVVSGTLPTLAPGQYRLRWQVLAIDGHLTRGDIPFSVKAP